jgi:hypothetical protein
VIYYSRFQFCYHFACFVNLLCHSAAHADHFVSFSAFTNSGKLVIWEVRLVISADVNLTLHLTAV